MKIDRYILFLTAIVVILAPVSATSGPDPVPITSEQAFDAVATGIDPVTGAHHGMGNIVIVDVRTPAEFQFQGTAGKVDSLLLKGADTFFVPDLGKVKLIHEGKFLEYSIEGKKKRTQIDKVAELVTSPIAVNIPCARWNDVTKEFEPAPVTFNLGMSELANKGVQVVITMCNSGGRSTSCLAKLLSNENAAQFNAFYEIDRAGDQYFNTEQGVHLAGLGGYQGSVYNGVYNGSVGFPGRQTANQPVQGWDQGTLNGPSVSWKDSGLPIFIPDTACNLPDTPAAP